MATSLIAELYMHTVCSASPGSWSPLGPAPSLPSRRIDPMSPSRLFWPAHRSLFRRRSRGGLGLVVACVAVGLVAAAAVAWPA